MKEDIRTTNAQGRDRMKDTCLFAAVSYVLASLCLYLFFHFLQEPPSPLTKVGSTVKPPYMVNQHSITLNTYLKMCKKPEEGTMIWL